jgi:hypothetical protein
MLLDVQLCGKLQSSDISIKKWFAEGNYFRSIPQIFRDVSVLLWSIEVSDLFRKGVSKCVKFSIQ